MFLLSKGRKRTAQAAASREEKLANLLSLSSREDAFCHCLRSKDPEDSCLAKANFSKGMISDIREEFWSKSRIGQFDDLYHLLLEGYMGKLTKDGRYRENADVDILLCQEKVCRQCFSAAMGFLADRDGLVKKGVRDKRVQRMLTYLRAQCVDENEGEEKDGKNTMKRTMTASLRPNHVRYQIHSNNELSREMLAWLEEKAKTAEKLPDEAVIRLDESTWMDVRNVSVSFFSHSLLFICCFGLYFCSFRSVSSFPDFSFCSLFGILLLFLFVFFLLLLFSVSSFFLLFSSFVYFLSG